MVDAIIQNMTTIGLAKLARAVAEVTLEESHSNFPVALAFLDSMTAAELLIRARILEVEVQNGMNSLQSEAVSALRLNELVYGSSRLSFIRLPQELEKISGYSLNKPQVYLEMSHLRSLIFREFLSPENLVKPTLRFAFEVIEPMLIEFWEEIILLHVPEYDFEIDQHIEGYLTKYEIKVHDHDGIGDY